MNRRLQLLNLFGVLVLAVLCIAQWRRDRQLNLNLNQLEKVRQIQLQKISAQEQAALGLSEDLARLKEHFKTEHDELEALRPKSRKAEGEIAQLTAERNQLRESVTNWSRAVSERDALAREANDRIRALSEDLNRSIGKFNELATNYNAIVKNVNETRTNSLGTNSP